MRLLQQGHWGPMEPLRRIHHHFEEKTKKQELNVRSLKQEKIGEITGRRDGKPSKGGSRSDE